MALLADFGMQLFGRAVAEELEASHRNVWREFESLRSNLLQEFEEVQKRVLQMGLEGLASEAEALRAEAVDLRTRLKREQAARQFAEAALRRADGAAKDAAAKDVVAVVPKPEAEEVSSADEQRDVFSDHLALLSRSPSSSPERGPRAAEARGRYGIWRVGCAMGYAASSVGTAGLKLFESTSVKAPSHMGLELEAVMLARELGGNWLEVSVESGPLFVHRRLAANSGVELKQLKDPSQIMASATTCNAFVFEGPLNPEASRALTALQSGWAMPATAPSFWVVLERLHARREPNFRATSTGTWSPGDVVLGKDAGDGWLRVISDQGLHFLYAWPPESTAQVRRVESAAEVLCSDVPRRPAPSECARLPRLGECPLQPKLEDVQRLVAGALARSGHSGVAEGDLTVQDISGSNRAYRTFKVAYAARPVHAGGLQSWRGLFTLRCERSRKSLSGVQRRVATEQHALAAAAFHAHDLGPKRVAAGLGWHLDAFVTSRPPAERAAESLRALDLAAIARLLAKVHSIPTGWCAPLADVGRRLLPGTGVGFAGTHVAVHACHPEDFVKCEARELAEWASTTLFHPKTPAASKLVTSHGQFKYTNIVVGEDGLPMCINLNRACVTFAVEDLALFVSQCCGTLPRRRAFLHEYLRATGYPFSNADVDDLLLDCRIYRLSLRWLQKDEKWREMKEVVGIIRTQKGPEADAIRRMVTEEWLSKPEVLKMAEDWKGPMRARSLPSRTHARALQQPPDARRRKGSRTRSARSQSLERDGGALAREEKWQEQDAVQRGGVALLALPSPAKTIGLTHNVGAAWGDNQPLTLLMEDDYMQLNHTWRSLLGALCRDPEVWAQPKVADVLEKALGVVPSHSTKLEIAGPMWVVMEGATGRGLLVRRSPEMNSGALHARLAVATVVQEMDRQGDRLKYERLRGDGPDIGWVSIQANGQLLLMQLPDISLHIGAH